MIKKISDDEDSGLITEFLKTYFDARVRKYGVGLQSVDWKSREAQYNRFQELLKVVDLSVRFSIIDYGCGDGELASFLTTAGLDFQYFGFDVSTQMVAAAQKRFLFSSNCLFSTSLANFPKADYVIASGIFNQKFEIGDGAWEAYIRSTILKINDLSHRGFAFNALTNYSDVKFQRADLFYADPLYWFNFCKKKVSRFVSLLHDYPEYDFTIIVRK